jgi:hypothetical protein
VYAGCFIKWRGPFDTHGATMVKVTRTVWPGHEPILIDVIFFLSTTITARIWLNSTSDWDNPCIYTLFIFILINNLIGMVSCEVSHHTTPRLTRNVFAYCNLRGTRVQVSEI